MIEVRFDNGVRGVTKPWVRRIVAETLASERHRGAAVTVFLTNDRQIRAINKRYLKHDYATDVISFGAGREAHYLGDLVVSVQMARKVAAELGMSFKEELARYLVHGTLHLLGYEDKKTADGKKMHARQERILKRIL